MKNMTVLKSNIYRNSLKTQVVHVTVTSVLKHSTWYGFQQEMSNNPLKRASLTYFTICSLLDKE
jgi:hypothetical protein